MAQRFDIETNISPPMSKVITLTHHSGLVIYVAQSLYGPKGENQTSQELDRVARLVAVALEE